METGNTTLYRAEREKMEVVSAHNIKTKRRDMNSISGHLTVVESRQIFLLS